MSGQFLALKTVDGFLLPSSFSADHFRSALAYKPGPDDIFLVTYPKCGTTWTSQILLLLLQRGKQLKKPSEFHSVPFLERTGAEAVENIPGPRLITTHLPFHLTPWSEDAKYIYVTRNPKDCCVSYYHHVKNIPGHNFEGTFDQFFEIFISGKIYWGDYFDHIRSWYSHRNYQNILFVTYEELKENFEAAIFKMASFIGDEKYAEPIRKDPEILENIKKYSSLKEMKIFIARSLVDIAEMTSDEVEKLQLRDSVKEQLAREKSNPEAAVERAERIEKSLRPGLIKSHLPFHLMPWSDEAKYIYVTRNPKDCCVSMFHYSKYIPGDSFEGTFDEFFGYFMSGMSTNIYFGDYFDHLLSWYTHRNSPNVLLLTYEEMKEDIDAAIFKMASFIDDEKYAEVLRKNPDILENIKKNSSLKQMRETISKQQTKIVRMAPEEFLESEAWPDTLKEYMVTEEDRNSRSAINLSERFNLISKLVRKGEIGDWKNYFSEDQNRQREEKILEKTEGTEIQKLWKKFIN